MNPIECIAIGNTGVEVTHSGLGGGAVSGMVLADGPYRARGYEEALRVITLTRMSQYAVESHGTPVGESTKTHPGTGRSTRYHLEGRSEVTMKVQVLQEKAPQGGQGAPRP